MHESGYYPPGAEFDPSAPYNQVDPLDEPMQVTVSITLSKTFTINMPNPGHWEKDEDGEAYWESERGPITVDDVKNSVYLPDEILDDVFNHRRMEAFEATCAGDWNVDDVEVIEE